MSDRRREEWYVLCFFLGLIVVLALMGLARGAPAPLPKTPPAPVTAAEAVGVYRTTCGGAPFEFECARGGRLWAQWQGKLWVGTWAVGAGVLTVAEWQDDGRPEAPPNPYRWHVRLARDRKGRVVRDGCAIRYGVPEAP